MPLITVTSSPFSPCKVVPSGTESDTFVVAFSSLEVFSTVIVYLTICPSLTLSLSVNSVIFSSSFPSSSLIISTKLAVLFDFITGFFVGVGSPFSSLFDGSSSAIATFLIVPFVPLLTITLNETEYVFPGSIPKFHKFQ